MALVNGEEPMSTSHIEKPESQTCKCEGQLSQIWTWLGVLDQKVSWLQQQHQQQQLRTPAFSYGYSDRSSFSSMLSSPSSVVSPLPHMNESFNQGDTQTESDCKLFGSFTKEQLLAKIDGIVDFSKAAKVLFRALYTEEEYKGRTLYGGKPNSRFAQRPCLEDPSKLTIIYEIIKERFNHESTIVKDKIREILKPSRN